MCRPGISTTKAQLRSDDGNLFVELDHATGKCTIKAPTMIVLDTPMVQFTGGWAVLNEGGLPTPAEVQGDIHMTGNLAADGDIAADGDLTSGGTVSGANVQGGTVVSGSGGTSVTLGTHRHPGNNTPPTPGT
jgi:hypothetical protein